MQLTELEKLQFKETRTEKQEERLVELTKKRDAKPEGVSTGCKSFLLQLYAVAKYGNRYKLKVAGAGIPWAIKGIKTECVGVSLLEQISGKKYHKNKSRIKNDYLTGILDLVNAPDIASATLVADIKSSYELKEQLEQLQKPLPKSSWWEMQGYLAITGIEAGEVHYCLLGHTEDVIQEQKEIFFASNITTAASIMQWEKNANELRFKDIPPEERIISYTIEKDLAAIDHIYERVELCRKWLIGYDKLHREMISERENIIVPSYYKVI